MLTSCGIGPGLEAVSLALCGKLGVTSICTGGVFVYTE